MAESWLKEFHIEYKYRTDINISNKYIDLTFRDRVISNRCNSVSNKNIIIGVAYRPPDTDVNTIIFIVYTTHILSAMKN